MKRLINPILIKGRKKHSSTFENSPNKLLIFICLADTNADPEGINYIIPGNDDAIRSVKLVASKLADAVLEGKQLKEAKANTGKIESIKAEDAGVTAEETATV